MNKFFVWTGGRKVGLGIVGAVVLTVMAIVLRAPFEAYAAGILVCLGITQGTVAYEDVKRPFEWVEDGTAGNEKIERTEGWEGE